MMQYLFLFLLLVFSVCQAVEKPLSEEQLESINELESYFSQIDGVWEGEIKSFELNGAYPDTPYHYKNRIVISGNEVQLLTWKDDKWVQLQYDYKIIRHKTNALIYTHASEIAWVESVAILITLKNIDEMHILWQRTVNNYATNPESVDARGNFQHHSIFKRADT